MKISNGYKVLSGDEVCQCFSHLPPFRAKFPWIGGDLQTIVSRFRANKCKNLPVGYDVLLPFASSPEGLMARFNSLDIEAADKPTLILLHGLGGDQTSRYMQEAAQFFILRGFSTLRVNLRGAWGSSKTSTNIYHAGISDDLRQVLLGLPEPYKQKGVLLMGFSLGANIILKYLGEGDVPDFVRGAVSVSAPLDLKQSQLRIAAFRNRLFRRYLLGELVKTFKSAQWSRHVPPLCDVEKMKSIIEFDECVIAPLYGFKNADDYYNQSSSKNFIKNISKPTLIIHAKTDPWISLSQYANIDWIENKSVCTLLTDDGGHVGFYAQDLDFPWHLYAAENMFHLAMQKSF